MDSPGAKKAIVAYESLDDMTARDVDIDEPENWMVNTITSAFAGNDNDAPATCTLTQADKHVGDHVCPVVGSQRVQYFEEGLKLQKLLEASGEDLGRTFSLDKDSISATSAGKTGGFACAVSDPTETDCPLMFVSNGFENLTGFTSSFAAGRSCRFLQPTSKVLNDAVNLEERKIMREFCTAMQPAGTTIINLLLNERFTGERFWNLLRMQYVEVDGDTYIFAVQTNLDAFMPKVLQKRLKNKAKNQSIVNALGGFLEALSKLREDLRTMKSAPIMELKGYFTSQMNFLQLLPAISKVAPGKLPSDLATAGEPSQRFESGAEIEVVRTIKYPTFALPAKLTGKVISMDSFGNAVIRWNDTAIGSKGLLKRDFKSLKVIAASGNEPRPDHGG